MQQKLNFPQRFERKEFFSLFYLFVQHFHIYGNSRIYPITDINKHPQLHKQKKSLKIAPNVEKSEKLRKPK